MTDDNFKERALASLAVIEKNTAESAAALRSLRDALAPLAHELTRVAPQILANAGSDMLGSLLGGVVKIVLGGGRKSSSQDPPCSGFDLGDIASIGGKGEIVCVNPLHSGWCTLKESDGCLLIREAKADEVAPGRG